MQSAPARSAWAGSPPNVSAQEAARLARTRRLAGWLLGFCVVSLLLQAWLLTTSFYFELWQAVVPLSWQ